MSTTILRAFPQRQPATGLVAAAGAYNTTDRPWTDPTGEPVDWRAGLQVQRSTCSGVQAHPLGCTAECCAPTGVTYDAMPGVDRFSPFRLFDALCLSQSCGNGILDMLTADFDALWPVAVGRVFHTGIGDNPGLQDTASVVVPDTTMSAAVAVSTLLRSRGVAGLSGGWLHVPAAAAPKLAPVLDSMGAAFGAVFDRVVVDLGYPTTGPTGTTVSTSEAWIYVSGPAVVAVSSERATPDVRMLRDGSTVDVFRDPNSGCYRPSVDRLATVVWQTCGVFAVRVDIS